MPRLLAAIALATTLAAGAAAAQDTPPTQPADPTFPLWLAQLKQDALAQGISRTTLDAALGDFQQPLARVIELDQRQPEFVDTFWNYLDQRVNPRRLAQGLNKLREHRVLLGRVQKQHGVPAALLVSFWGMETHYGAYTGGFPIPAALATLAYDNRRSDFFRDELLEALRILDAGHIAAAEMRGSWAGAMGQMQFMPSTFQRHALDADGDGRKDIWHSLPDAMHSAAHYLRQAGWRPGELWGREVRLPADFDWDEARLGLRKPVKTWAALGVRQADGKPLARSDLAGAIVLPQGHAGPAFLVYRNFEVIMAWNRSLNYALAVAHLADRLTGQPALVLGRAVDNRRLSREQIIALQRELGARGLDVGEADGIPGTKTRAAIRVLQKTVGLPADGHPSMALLESLGLVPVAALAAVPADTVTP